MPLKSLRPTTPVADPATLECQRGAERQVELCSWGYEVQNAGQRNKPLGVTQGVLMYRENAIEEMKMVFKDIPYGVDHTNRVLSNAEYIMNGEAISSSMRETISLAAVLHDIGAIEAQKKYGSMEGHFQEIEGPAIARSILERIGAPTDITNRVCYIVGHHHTPAKIDGIDFQIVWEADYLEYLQFGEKEKDEGTLHKKVLENFRTPTGRQLAYERLDISSLSQ